MRSIAQTGDEEDRTDENELCSRLSLLCRSRKVYITKKKRTQEHVEKSKAKTKQAKKKRSQKKSKKKSPRKSHGKRISAFQITEFLLRYEHGQLTHASVALTCHICAASAIILVRPSLCLYNVIVSSKRGVQLQMVQTWLKVALVLVRFVVFVPGWRYSSRHDLQNGLN